MIEHREMNLKLCNNLPQTGAPDILRKYHSFKLNPAPQTVQFAPGLEKWVASLG
jgi:hypothetical protein